ncbi:hypothetical protein [Allokutzneria sp. NRRL B-24872]|uniref:hypothetical protein n=1 Tax=Allokutzneria sp. NRRL B-24872 TaxID=1137961 RepID=UPI00143DA59D|nr:hypothetical protein [Allokutzneria sp. NRRL B-24872]
MSDEEVRYPLFAAPQPVAFLDGAPPQDGGNEAALETLLNMSRALLLVLHDTRREE